MGHWIVAGELLSVNKHTIQTNELTKVYSSIIPGRQQVALDRLSMSVPSGEVFGFLGPNGAGKTTTLKLLLGLSEPTSGTGEILGKSIGDPAIREEIGYLAENPTFYDYLCADEFLKYCAKFFRLGRKERARRADRLLDYVGLSDNKSEKLSSFSKGMLQRVGLAQALINDPQLLLLDEPMSGLDPMGRKQFKDLIRHACQDEGKTVFFCSHVLAEVEEVCDRVAILSEGRLLTQDTLDNLLYLDETIFRLKGVDENLLAAMRHEGCSIDTDGDVRIVHVAGEEKANRIDELVEKSDVELVAKEVKSESLEEFFVRSVSESRGDR